jgi:hypothetical protein
VTALKQVIRAKMWSDFNSAAVPASIPDVETAGGNSRSVRMKTFDISRYRRVAPPMVVWLRLNVVEHGRIASSLFESPGQQAIRSVA